MDSLFFKRAILSLSLIALSTLAAPITSGENLDACGSLDATDWRNITYSDVFKCYKSIPFDTVIAASTMETIQTLFDVHYSFRDSALTPDLGSPFSSPPVDIMKELKSITTKSFGDDFSFHAAVSTTLATLHDGHVVYNRELIVPLLFVVFTLQIGFLTHALLDMPSLLL